MKTLKILRVLVAAGMFVLVTLFFLGLGGGFGLLEKIQVGTALLGCSVIPLVAWFAATLLFGRVYCSVACPLGILQDVLGRLVKLVWWRMRYAPRPDRPWVRVAAMLVFAVLAVCGGVSLAGLLDPYSVFGRIASGLLQPAAEWMNNALADHLGTEGAVVLFKREVFVRSVEGLVVSASALVLLLVLVAWKGRLVCNTVCPMGAVLAVLSKKPAFRIAIDPAKCVKCGLCSGACKALCLDGKAQLVDNARCVRCFNCIGACPKGAISFAPAWTACLEPKADESRRAFLATAGAGVVAAGTVACASGRVAVGAAREDVLPPPGTDAAKLNAKCTACGLCVAKCPKKVLVPAEYGAYGPLSFLQPRMDFAHGFCDPNCTTCGEVCPTGAIPLLDLAGKKQTKIGLAAFDSAKCLACTEKIPCGLCERRCPQKAISLKETEIKAGGKSVKVQMPVVDAAKCTGCGACENYCPAQAMRVRGLPRAEAK